MQEAANVAAAAAMHAAITSAHRGARPPATIPRGVHVQPLALRVIGGLFLTKRIVIGRAAVIAVSDVEHIRATEQVHLILRDATHAILGVVFFGISRACQGVVNGGGENERLFQLVEGGVIEGIVEPGADRAVFIFVCIRARRGAVRVGIPEVVRSLIHLILEGLRVKDHIAKQGGDVAVLVDDRPGDGLELKPVYVFRAVAVCGLVTVGIIDRPFRPRLCHIDTAVGCAVVGDILIPHIMLYLS